MQNAQEQLLQLFKSTFRGREDVVPRFWQSKDRRKGYAPICRNERQPICKKPCHRCEHKDYVPVDDSLLGGHLRGDHILGVYPLLSDNRCWFLALDFDNHDGQRDPLADVQTFHAVCRTHKLACYVLRSKSGEGYHCYIFFNQPVPAWKARKVATAILKEAQIGGANSSFDRLFPNQDELTKEKPLGNLIALPFQGEAQKLGHTLLLDPDTDFEKPYLDQVQVLKSLQRVSESELDQIAETLISPGGIDLPAKPRGDKAGCGIATSEKIPEGERNVRLTSLAGSLRRKGKEHPEILAALLEINASSCVPPLSESEVGQIARSVSQYPAANGNAVDLEGARKLVAHLPEAVKSDPGVAFFEETLAALKMIKGGDMATWARLRKSLSKHISLQDLITAIEKTGQVTKNPILSDSGCPYRTEGGIFSIVRQTSDGEALNPLSNFTARIVGEKIYDDGAEQMTLFSIEGQLQEGTPLPLIEIPAGQFPTMAWVTSKWGSRPVIHAGQGTKDHVRTAIQLTSSDIAKQVIYGHLGWRRLQGKWLYLHCGGAIGEHGVVEDICVRPGDGRINDFALPAPPDKEQTIEAIHASLEIMQVAPAHITVPLLAGVYRSVLAEVLPVDFSLFLAGRTGAQKSELSALAQAHFGASFNGKNLPGNWYGTANSLEKIAFLAKDAVFTVDDFVPTGNSKSVTEMHGKAERLLRGQGNRSGRPRMKPDGSLRHEYYPRGLILASGEDTPTGQSLRSRMLILEVKPGDVDLDLLTRLQAAAREGLLAQAMSAYLQWLAPKMNDLRASLLGLQQDLRRQMREALPGTHDRTPDIIASLYLGWNNFLTFAHEMGAIPDDPSASYDVVPLFDDSWAALMHAGKSQPQQQASEDLVNQFLRLLSAVLNSGKAHLADMATNDAPADAASWGWRRKGLEDIPQGPRIGWLDGEDIFLIPETTFGVVQELARSQGGSIPVTEQTLWKRLADRDVLASTEPGRNTVRRMVGNKRLYVLHLTKEVLEWQDPSHLNPEEVVWDCF